MAHANQGDPASPWTVVCEDRFDSRASLFRWAAQAGEWTLSAEGLRKIGANREGVLRLHPPVVAGDVRVTFEARSEAPGDLGLVMGSTNGLPGEGIYFGFASRGNTANRLLVGRREVARTEAPLAVPGQWHRIVATRADGRLTLEVDGVAALSAPDPAEGLPGDQLAFYLWDTGQIRFIRVERREDDPSREAHLDATGRAREAAARERIAAYRVPDAPVPDAPLRPAILHISPAGRDNWSGGLSEPNAEGTDGPLATLEAARDRLRDWRRAEPLHGGATVWVHAGRYPRETPFVLDPEDSGRVEYAPGSAPSTLQPVYNPRRTELPASFRLEGAITYAAWPGDAPVIDGGRPINGWREETLNGRPVWVADLPEVRAGDWSFRQLFVEGERRPRTRLPREGFYEMADVPGLELPSRWGGPKQDAFICAEGDFKSGHNLGDVEVVALHFWIEERFPVVAFDPVTRRVSLGRMSRAPLADDYQERFAKYYVENVFEALEHPGEWYLDRPAGRLYYLPKAGETPERTRVVAPRALQLLALRGDPAAGAWVEHVHFRGLTFQHTDWRHPGEDGAPESTVSWEPSLANQQRRGGAAAASQAAWDVPGVVTLVGARGCRIEACRVANVGWTGIELSFGCSENRVVGNTLYDLGAGGVRINGGDLADPPATRTSANRLSDNQIQSGGRVFHSAVGVLLMRADRHAVVHNHIHDFYYTGISVGWTWGYRETVTRDHLIAYNHIHDIGQGWLSDMGGIYTLGVQPGTVLRGNRIHDVRKASYGGWAIYPDEGSAHLLIEDNICYRTNGEIFHQHYGRENIVRNNIFAFGDEGIVKYTLAEAHVGFTLQRNILISDGTPLIVGRYGPAGSRIDSDRNLFWDIQGDPVLSAATVWPPPGFTNALDLAAWQALGHDRHSRVADPRFADFAGDDWTLASDSPALMLGFQPPPPVPVGPRPAREWE